MKRIDAAVLKQAIRARRGTPGRELAIVDAREEGEFGASHLFWAVPVPLSRLELRARALLPRASVPIVVTDDGSGLAERAAGQLAGMGYTDVAVLDGGTPAWKEAGGELFSGVNVPSKAFGEWVEHEYETPSIDPDELKALIDRRADMVILDSRPMGEFEKMTIPGAMNVPGAELLFRIGDIAPRPDTLVVVNCAGRTRSIMGAESLRIAGVPNRVLALRNGTMGFELAGFGCAHGARDRFPGGMPRNTEAARKAAERLATAHGVGLVDATTLATWRADVSRTTYLFDVREEDEFLLGRVPGSRHAPGGQLVQATDSWVGVLGARIVLVDTAIEDGGGIRSRMTAQWLAQMGHRDVHVFDARKEHLTEAGRRAEPCPERDAVVVDRLTPEQLSTRLEAGGTVLIDLSRSIDFRAGHIKGSHWGIRTRLDRLVHQIAGSAVALVSPDGDLALLAVDEVRGLGARDVAVLAGGLAAWRRVGMQLVADRAVPADADCADCYLRPYDRNDGVEEAMRAYLTWEIALPEQVARDGDVVFGPRHA
jgi:rhodanese-related sulfurtransferase